MIMLFWITCAFITFAAILAVFSSVFKNNTEFEDQKDLFFYKNQLAEIENDEKNGVLSESDAASSRIEIGRRILKCDEKAAKSLSVNPPSKWLISSMILIIPLASWGLYASLGSPYLSDQPLLERTKAMNDGDNLEVLIQKTQAHLASNPNDGRGWQVLAPVYFKLGRYKEAIFAYEKSILLNPQSATDYIGLGKSLTEANNGLMNDQARAAYTRAVDIEPSNQEARFLLALDLSKSGKLEEASRAFEDLLKTTDANDPFFTLIQTMIEKINAKVENP